AADGLLKRTAVHRLNDFFVIIVILIRHIVIVIRLIIRIIRRIRIAQHIIIADIILGIAPKRHIIIVRVFILVILTQFKPVTNLRRTLGKTSAGIILKRLIRLLVNECTLRFILRRLQVILFHKRRARR